MRSVSPHLVFLATLVPTTGCYYSFYGEIDDIAKGSSTTSASTSSASNPTLTVPQDPTTSESSGTFASSTSTDSDAHDASTYAVASTSSDTGQTTSTGDTTFASTTTGADPVEEACEMKNPNWQCLPTLMDSMLIDTPTCTANCTASSCGDAYVNSAAGEFCEQSITPECSPVTCTLCGNGTIDISAKEECDEGTNNSDDSLAFCTTDCIRQGRLAFTSSVAVTGNIVPPPAWGEQVQGIDAAHRICQRLAETIPEIASQETKSSFLAWLSVRKEGVTNEPRDYFANCNTPYYLPKVSQNTEPSEKDKLISLFGSATAGDRHLIKENLIDLKNLKNPIALNENGRLAELVSEVAIALTATEPDGKMHSSHDDCSNWTSESILESIVRGNSHLKDTGWTHIDDFGECNWTRHLYCFEECPP